MDEQKYIPVPTPFSCKAVDAQTAYLDGIFNDWDPVFESHETAGECNLGHLY